MTESVTFCLTNLLLCVSLYIDNEIGFVMTIFVKKAIAADTIGHAFWFTVLGLTLISIIVV